MLTDVLQDHGICIANTHTYLIGTTVNGNNKATPPKTNDAAKVGCVSNNLRNSLPNICSIVFALTPLDFFYIYIHNLLLYYRVGSLNCPVFLFEHNATQQNTLIAIDKVCFLNSVSKADTPLLTSYFNEQSRETGMGIGSSSKLLHLYIKENNNNK